MACPEQLQQPPNTEVAELIESLKTTGPTTATIMTIGKGGSGKTSLANAVLTNNSSGGHFGPKRGSSGLVTTRTEPFPAVGVDLTVHDLMGLADIYFSDEELNEAVQEECDIDSVAVVIVCIKWSERFDEISRRILKRIDNLHSSIWEKVIFALTHFDQTPPEYKDMDKPQRDQKLTEFLSEWRKILRRELSILNVSEDITDNMGIVPTSHTAVSIDKHYFGALFADGVSNWLENFWQQLAQTFVRYQPLNLVNIFSTLGTFLFHQMQSTVGNMTVTVKQVEKFLTSKNIARIFLGGLMGGAVGSGLIGTASALGLAELIGIVLSLSVVGATATAATGGAFGGVVIGAAGVACLVGVVLYAVHVYRQRNTVRHRIIN